MTGIAGLLSMVILGFTVLATSQLTRYWLVRQSGYMLFFAVILVGWLSVFMIDSVYLFVSWGLDLSNSQEKGILARTVEEGGSFALNQTGPAAIGLLLICLLINPFLNKMKWAKRIAKFQGDLSEVLLQEAMERRQVEITMNNGKSYVGYPIETGVTTSSEADISILVTMSGYRESETKELMLDCFYGKIDLENDRKRDFMVVLPKQKIESVRLFDPAIYVQFIEQRQQA